jgi:hypothetical protein
MTFPSKEEYGKAWISKYFTFNDLVISWYWKAADVTWINSELSLHENMITMSMYRDMSLSSRGPLQSWHRKRRTRNIALRLEKYGKRM